MTLERATEYALVEMAKMAAARATPRTRKERFGRLTAREREVAAHIAQGESNREIAQKLVLSERTIETHVTHILTKLGFTSRAQISRWAVEKGLVTRME